MLAYVHYDGFSTLTELTPDIDTRVKLEGPNGFVAGFVEPTNDVPLELDYAATYVCIQFPELIYTYDSATQWWRSTSGWSFNDDAMLKKVQLRRVIKEVSN